MDANNNHNSKVNDFPEAPASWNTRYVDPNGFECQITLRGESGSELLEKATNAINYLLQNGCTPYTYCHNGSRQVESKPDEGKKEELKTDGKDNPANFLLLSMGIDGRRCSTWLCQQVCAGASYLCFVGKTWIGLSAPSESISS